MKQLQKRENERQLIPPMIPNDLIPQYTTVDRETTTTTVTTRERTTYLTFAPICGTCGERKERAIGPFWICRNCDPDPAAAIPVTAEGKAVIDVKPIRRKAA